MSSKNAILAKMLDRLFAGLASGPNLNCRPHSSRQRLDWTQFAKLQDIGPGEALRRLLSDKHSAQLQAKVSSPRPGGKSSNGRKRTTGPATTEPPNTVENSGIDEELSPADKQHRDSWSAQQSLLTKLRGLAEDARDYEQDTGVHVLHVGFPLLSLPPGSGGSLKSSVGGTKRLLAPIAFIPVTLELRSGVNPLVVIEGGHDGTEFLVPNEALFAWLERQTGQSILPDTPLGSSAPETAESKSETSESAAAAAATSAATPDPWEELNDLIRRVTSALHLPACVITPESLDQLASSPRGDADESRAEIVPAAVLGLFPMNNQSLLRDMQAMVADPTTVVGPVQSFLSTDVLLEESPEELQPSSLDSSGANDQAVSPHPRAFSTERLVTMADPCQARAVRLARECQGLVIHGPPGTGKSQTITNIIGDHLARGERVLLVCDKRTALDVVARRLEHIGLGSLCALIHDPQHDQRNLYLQVREQLEALTSTPIGQRATAQLQALDRQLQKSHNTLSQAWSLVMSPDAGRGTTFHERMGEWLSMATPSLLNSSTESPLPTAASRKRKDKAAVPDREPASVSLLELHGTEVNDVIRRAIQVQYASNPWTKCVGIPLTRFLETPAAEIRQRLQAIVDAAKSVDATCEDGCPPFVLPDPSLQSSPTGFPEQKIARQELATRLRRCVQEISPAIRAHWASVADRDIERARVQLNEIAHARTVLKSGLVEPELQLTYLAAKPTPAEIASQLGTLEAYLQNCDAWYSWFSFKLRGAAQTLLQSYGLAPGRVSAERLRAFLTMARARMVVASALSELAAPARSTNIADEAIPVLMDQHEQVIQLRLDVGQHPALSSLQSQLQLALTAPNHEFQTALEDSADRADGLEDLRQELVESHLFRADWMQGLLQRACLGEAIVADLQELASNVDSLGEVLRIQALLAKLPGSLRGIIERVASTGETDVEVALNAVRFQVLSDDLDQWLKANPDLQGLDGQQLTNLHREIHQLGYDKQPCVRDLILEIWVGRQRERLLASTGSRLSGLGADLRRRLTTRGERAMRLRQVIAIGDKIDGGDPLFDLKPVWMASPETVAQIFPREALFDVVIFDEASQCRLEEALPVLMRAKRVVIAGDPKQLPPTRFFESAVITSDNVEAETEQELFEAHQSEIEDLLTAALSLDIQESHLDVHYRSRNSDLVEFSNHQFYGSRLQAIPGHPRNRIRFAPITVYPVGGVYEERTNIAEAEQVARIVADLLRRSEPPSIGIACFNLTQRDLILDTLDALATEDRDFAERLATARSRVGAGAFEGLFVKNLENVQGDERDHMIISTTYGPDKQGRFFRRFGPLGQAGGGRRLNVLVTRAREEVHLVTSIPAQYYRSLPPIPEGQQPGGGWLLFAYLQYAERLAQSYQEWRHESPDEPFPPGQVHVRPSQTPSSFSRELGRLIAQRDRLGTDIHWGNDGFCVDVAFHHPKYPEDRTLGLLCDGTRFRYADDPIAWDVFRMAILEGQGWQLNRVWTPQFFRDPEGYLKKFVTEAARIAESDPDPEGIPVEPDAG